MPKRRLKHKAIRRVKTPTGRCRPRPEGAVYIAQDVSPGSQPKKGTSPVGTTQPEPDIQKERNAVIEFKLPELGENIEQGDLVRLMIEPGASVSAGQSVMELETDKAVVEVPSSVTGTVQEIRVKQGDKVKVGQVVFTVDGNGAPKEAAPAAATTKPAAPESKPQPKPQPAAQVEPPPTT